MSKKFNDGKTVGETREVVCRRCDQQTNHAVRGSVMYSWSTQDIQGVDIYEIIQCKGCDALSFRIGSSNSEDFDVVDDEMIHPETEEIYPSRLMGRTEMEDIYSLPEKIRTLYKETHAAMSTKHRILSGMGIRALIEAVCLEEKADGKNLEKRIDDLVTKGVLTKRNAEVLHKTRFLGNRAAHEIYAAKDTELEVAFDVVENLLETVYVIPDKAEWLKAK